MKKLCLAASLMAFSGMVLASTIPPPYPPTHHHIFPPHVNPSPGPVIPNMKSTGNLTPSTSLPQPAVQMATYQQMQRNSRYISVSTALAGIHYISGDRFQVGIAGSANQDKQSALAVGTAFQPTQNLLVTAEMGATRHGDIAGTVGATLGFK